MDARVLFRSSYSFRCSVRRRRHRRRQLGRRAYVYLEVGGRLVYGVARDANIVTRRCAARSSRSTAMR